MHQPVHLPFSGALLAEAVRVYEEGRGSAGIEPGADAAARAGGGPFERRIVARAEALSLAPALKVAFRQLAGACALALVGGSLFAATAGVGTASAVLGAPQGAPVNIFFALAGLIGLPILLLIAWALLMVVRPGGAVSLLGKAVFAAGGRIARLLDQGPMAIATVRAAAVVFAGSPLGRWSLSAISHALWLAYLLGALVAVVVLLSTKEFTFTWETTILSEGSYIRITEGIAALPALIGFPAPDATDVAASQKGAPLAAAERVRGAWAGLLIGCVAVYGVLPRLALLIVSLLAAWRAARRCRLDVSHPGYARLRPMLLPPSAPTGIIDADTPENRLADERGGAGGPPPAFGRDGPAAILGLEIEPPASGWPPDAAGVDWLDLGFADDRGSRRRIIETIGSLPAPPRLIVAVCSLTQAPDRGHRIFIADLQRLTGIAVVVLLSDGERLRARGQPQHLAQRVADWRRLAATAGVPDERTVEIDLDHLTAASRAGLLAAIGHGGGEREASPPINIAFGLIADHAKRWQGPPDPPERAELQRAIAGVYRSRRARWQALLRVRIESDVPSVEQLKAGAEGVLTLLPARLKGSLGWLAAGASAGALGCVAAATLLSPAAIVALPAWAGLGTALAAALRASLGGRGETPVAPDGSCGQAVAAAALFALVLHLQGRSETAITAILDKVLPADEPPEMREPEAVRDWLAGLERRLEQALAEDAEEPR